MAKVVRVTVCASEPVIRDGRGSTSDEYWIKSGRRIENKKKTHAAKTRAMCYVWSRRIPTYATESICLVRNRLERVEAFPTGIRNSVLAIVEPIAARMD